MTYIDLIIVASLGFLTGIICASLSLPVWVATLAGGLVGFAYFVGVKT